MARLRRFLLRLRNALRPYRAEPDLAREVDSHLRLMRDDFERQGLAPDQALTAARARFGGVEQTKERHRDIRSFVWIDAIRCDVVYALRAARNNKGLALLVVAVLALGIGANTAVFSVVNAILLKSLPFPDPDRIVTLSTSLAGSEPGLSGQIADADFDDWRGQASSFEAMTYFAARPAAVVARDRAEFARVATVSGEFFKVFGVQPVAGRLFDVDDPPPAALVVSHAFAQSHFGGADQAVGRTIRLFNRSFPIGSVVPPAFTFPEGTEIWTRIPQPTTQNPPRRSSLSFRAAARLKRGISLDQAQSEMTTIAGRLERQYADTNVGRRIVVMRLHDQMVGNVRLMLYVLLGAVGLVLLLACTNLATLLLARATARTREITVRAALGASRARIVRQMLAEGLLQGLIAGAAGLALAFAGMRALVAFIPADVPRLAEIAIDRRVLLFTLVVSLVSSVLLALAPAFQASLVRVEHALRQSGARSVGGARTRRVREALVVVQIAIAVVVLTGGTLLIRSFVALQHVALGFRPENVLVIDARVATSNPRQDASLFFRDLIAEMSRVPGVVAAGATMAAPGRVDSTGGYWIDRVPQPSDMAKGPSAVLSIVSPGTFGALGTPIVSGRDFDDRDVRDAAMTAIVNETLARRAFPGRDIVGHRIVCAFDTNEPMTIVGVVGDVRQAGPAQESRPECYMPYLQHNYNGATLSVVIRTTTDPMALAETVRRKARELEPGVPVRFTTLESLTAQNVAQPRFRALLIGEFAAVALVLAVIGVFGVMAYAVSQRTSEIGLRVALGATPAEIRWLVFGRGLALMGIGVAAGLFGAALAARYLDSLLFEITPTDPATYLGVASILAATSLAAMYVPAARATRIDPIVALRCE